MTNAIGGYFGLELANGDHHYHTTPHVSKSGRASLVCILQTVQPSRVYIPYYTCDSLLEPFRHTGTEFVFYAVDEKLEPAEMPVLAPGEYFLYVNYLDIKRDAVARLSAHYKDRLIVDCTQAFFAKGDGVSWYFNSCRKFFGVPDGSYLYAPAGINFKVPGTRNEVYSTGHLLQRFNGNVREGYTEFQENEELAGEGVFTISKLSEHLLSHINYKDVAEERQANFRLLHERLKQCNLMNVEIGEEVPIAYPLLLNRVVDRQPFFEKDIFIPSFWKDIQTRNVSGFDFEKRLTDTLYPLPIDHRYGQEEMEILFSAVKAILL